MAKYIDAEKLKAEIERLYDGEAPKHDQQCDFDDGYFTGIGAISKFIDSLQQEQPEGLHFTPLNRLIQKIPSEKWNDTINNYAKKLRDCLIEEGYRKDAEVLQGYISYMNGNNVPMATMDEHKQLEVDLEKELDKFYGMYRKDGKTYDITSDEEVSDWKENGNFLFEIELAHHFYELGLKTKEE